ncbi:TRAF3-interacting protein 1 [Microplitis demolitor]|uniref:TRAF3-interacting protein 1 n=1 Tax=Microplitis demolitor TaxID=69319 RepID=UPI0004CD2C31|nr:TRAF3-interacting protein 1 [Microplitis demolitor]
MSEDIKLQEAVKKTQDLLGKYIKKPPLTDKLLKKPPFRFIHDIITSIIKETGFLKNLFTDDELISTNISDKEAKIEYLTKLIDAVKLITGNNDLNVRPSKIISGQEPIKTNELFHAIGRALDKKVSSDEAIEYFKNNINKKSKEKSLKKKSRSPEVNLPSNEKSGVKKTVRKSTDKLDKVGKESDKKRSSTKQSGEVKKRDSSIDRKVSDNSKTTKDNLKKKDTSGKKKDDKKPTEKRVRSKESSHKETVLPAKVEKSADLEDKTDLPKVDNKEEVNEVQDFVGVEEAATVKSEQKDVIEDSNLESSEPVNDKTVPKTADKTEEKEVKPDGLKKQSKSVELVDNRVDGIKNSGIGKTSSGFLRPPTARPPSARPAAPRLRGKTDFIINNNVANQIADINVIVQNFDMKEDDAEDMVVVESSVNDDNNSLLNINNINISNDLNDKQVTQEHGYLVAQILETQRELVNEDNVELIPNKVEIEWESGVKKDRDFVIKEIDKLRGTIQTLTRTTNPLGKLFDFLQEDVEIMQRELRDWRNQFNGIREQLIVEKSKTSNLLKPLEDSLSEVENNIKLQMDKIYQTKANILKNNSKISRLLSGQ